MYGLAGRSYFERGGAGPCWWRAGTGCTSDLASALRQCSLVRRRAPTDVRTLFEEEAGARGELGDSKSAASRRAKEVDKQSVCQGIG